MASYKLEMGEFEEFKNFIDQIQNILDSIHGNYIFYYNIFIQYKGVNPFVYSNFYKILSSYTKVINFFFYMKGNYFLD